MAQTVGWTLWALGSVALHGAVLLTALGHPTASPGAADSPTELTIDVEPTPLLSDVPSPDPAADRMPGAAAPHSHTHPYPVPPSHDWTPHDPSLVHVFASTAAAAPHVDAPHDDVVATEPVPDAAMPHFTLPGGSEVSGPTGAAAGTAAAGASGAAGGTSTLESEQTVSVRARLVRGVAPHYPSEARDEGIEADVPLEIIVSADGVVESARGLGRADHGFEAAALDAIRGYRFAPASRDGHAVRVRMRWTMEFRLR